MLCARLSRAASGFLRPVHLRRPPHWGWVWLDTVAVVCCLIAPILGVWLGTVMLVCCPSAPILGVAYLQLAVIQSESMWRLWQAFSSGCSCLPWLWKLCMVQGHTISSAVTLHHVRFLVCATTALFDGLLGCRVCGAALFPCDLVTMLQCIHRGFRCTSQPPLCHGLLSSVVQKVGQVCVMETPATLLGCVHSGRHAAIFGSTAAAMVTLRVLLLTQQPGPQSLMGPV